MNSTKLSAIWRASSRVNFLDVRGCQCRRVAWSLSCRFFSTFPFRLGFAFLVRAAMATWEVRLCTRDLRQRPAGVIVRGSVAVAPEVPSVYEQTGWFGLPHPAGRRWLREPAAGTW